MPRLDFIDKVKITIRAGDGGSGSRHFRRERHVPKGGPDGGNGGRGGHIFFEGNRNLSTLLDFRYKKHTVAPNGEHGGGSHCRGANGSDVMLQVPLGTVIKDKDDNICGEITQHQAQLMIAKGGRGGKGNAHFKSATNQTPDFVQTGEKNEDIPLVLELKLIANVGLVGTPNTGKSTLLSVVSAARPKIGSYPFTTLVPNLGVVSHKPQQTFVMADIPGLIQGAAQGQGLGTRFLRHIERTEVLLFMVSVETEDIMREYQMLEEELRAHNPSLLQKPRMLAITKTDMLTPKALANMVKTLTIPHLCISSVAEQGIPELKQALWNLLQQ